jgi:hypothetical protein
MVRGTPAGAGTREAEPARSEEISMHIPTWRLAMTGGALVIFAVIGIGLVAAASAPATPAPNIVLAGGTPGPAAPAETRQPGHERFKDGHGAWGARLLRLGRHLVHAEATVTDKDGNLITLAFDHGTVKTFAGGTLTISEAGGGSETVTTDGATVVYVGRKDGKLEDVTGGDEVFVQSRVDGGTTLAKRILIVPAPSS